MNSFFTEHIFLKVGKTQDLLSKILQILGDPLGLSATPVSSIFLEH
jgi:hypothetical protein